MSKEDLAELYLRKEYSIKEIAKIFNCNWHTINNKLKKFGIKTRTKKESKNTKRAKEKYSLKYSGKNSPSWKGGTKRTSRGYVLIWKRDHPRANIDGYVGRSHLVAEKMLGRYLKTDEIPHHKNEIKDDDRPENIDVMTEFNHKSFHRKNRGDKK